MGSDDTEFVGFDMGARVTQDLSVTLLRIWQEMSVQWDTMRQMLQVSKSDLNWTLDLDGLLHHLGQIYVLNTNSL